jgi:hypothetical protein
MNKTQMSQLTIEASILKSKYPNCREEINAAVTRIREEYREGQPEESVAVLARKLETSIKRMPCARIGKTSQRRKAAKGTKKGREQRRRITAR